MFTQQSQKVLLLPAAYGDFTLVSEPIPTPAPGTALVRVVAVGLNSVDRMLQKTAFGVYQLTFPTVLGLNIAGVVVSVGEGVTTLKEGDRV